MPQASACASKFSVRKGISISAVQPDGVRDPRGPDAVPRSIEVVLRGAAAAGARQDQRVAHGSRRVDLEVVAGPAIEVGIDRHHEPIVGRQRLIALHLVAEQL